MNFVMNHAPICKDQIFLSAAIKIIYRYAEEEYLDKIKCNQHAWTFSHYKVYVIYGFEPEIVINISFNYSESD